MFKRTPFDRNIPNHIRLDCAAESALIAALRTIAGDRVEHVHQTTDAARVLDPDTPSSILLGPHDTNTVHNHGATITVLVTDGGRELEASTYLWIDGHTTHQTTERVTLSDETDLRAIAARLIVATEH